MAGSYPDVPGHRMAYHRDGTVVTDAGTILNEAQKRTLGDETAGDTGFDGPIAFIFPELRNIVGILADIRNTGFTAEWSTNTSNGGDGSWSAVALTAGQSDGANHRLDIRPVTLNNVRGLRFTMADPATGSFHGIHVYGSPVSGQNPDRLRVWHPTNNEEIGGAYFDWGNTEQGSSADRTFRIRNNSATLSALDVTLSFDALTDTNPSLLDQYLLSADGQSFGATLNIGNLAPGATSQVLTVRRNTDPAATLSVWDPLLVAAAQNWS